MTRANKTIIVLVICLMVLSVICTKNKPLITGRYDSGPAEFVTRISKSQIGQKLIKHYDLQLNMLVKFGMGYYKYLKPSEPWKVNYAMAGMIFAGAFGLIGSLFSLVLFALNSGKEETMISRRVLFLILLLIIINGTIIRLVLASACYGNYDMQSYEMVADIVNEGGNVYAQTFRYNYSPLWFTLLGALRKVQLQYPAVPFHFVVRSFLCGVDLVALGFLLLIARQERKSLIKPAIFFYLNPVSFLLTGYHGQFENLAILMVMIGLYAYLKLKSNKVLGTAILWIFASAGMIVKHNIFYELIICLNAAIKRYRVKVPLFAVSVLVFLALFVPYWPQGKEGIIKNVFMYSIPGIHYGIIRLFTFMPLKYVFIAGMFLFPLFLKSEDIVEQCLLGMLFFVAFTTGFGIQYFILPIALGALRQSRGFLLYSLAGSLFILGNNNNVFVPGFHMVDRNVVWLAVMYWFITEMRNSKAATEAVRTLRQKISAVLPVKRNAG